MKAHLGCGCKGPHIHSQGTRGGKVASPTLGRIYTRGNSAVLILYEFEWTPRPVWTRGVVGRVASFQPGGPGSIYGGVRNFNFCPGIGCVSFVCVLSCVVFGGGPDILLTTHSGRPALVYLSSVLVETVAPPTGI